MMPRQLKNIQIDEVSSVDRGAGRGVRVLLTKRDDEGTNKMSVAAIQDALGVAHICKRASDAVAKGEMDQFAFAELQKQLAMKMFPQSLTEGEALNKFFNTEAGRTMLNAGCRANYEAVQKSVAAGNADSIEKSNKPVAEAVDNGDDDEGVEEPWDKKIANLMKEKNISYDAAASILHRAERVRKIGW